MELMSVCIRHWNEVQPGDIYSLILTSRIEKVRKSYSEAPSLCLLNFDSQLALDATHSLEFLFF